MSRPRMVFASMGRPLRTRSRSMARTKASETRRRFV
jgi:hypothetical protein